MKYIFEILKIIYKWSDTHSNFLIAVLTAALIIITAISVYYTKKMADVAFTQMNLELKPYAGFGNTINIEVRGIPPDFKQIAEKTNYIKLTYTIINLGKTPLIYSSTESSFNDIMESKSSAEILLYPGQTINYYTSEIIIPETKTEYLKGKAKIKIIYWGLGDSAHKYFVSREFTISGTTWKISQDQTGALK